MYNTSQGRDVKSMVTAFFIRRAYDENQTAKLSFRN